MNLLKKTSHLVHLDVRWPEDFRTGGEIVYNRNGKNFKADQLFQFLLRPFVIEDFSKVVDCVLIFVGEFPPVRAHLAYAAIV